MEAHTLEMHLIKKLTNHYKYIYNKKTKENTSLEELVESIVSYYEDIIKCMPGNVYWLDANAKTVGCNQNVLDMFGFKSINEFKGLTFEQMGKIGNWSTEAIKKFKKDTLDVVKTKKAVLNREEPPIPHSNGRMIYFLTSRVPLFDKENNVVGVVGISIDITEKKEMEDALFKAKEKAEVANEAKSEFIANMSHDIRTPLSGMIGMSSAIIHESKEPQIKEYANDVLNCSKQLLKLLNDIIEVSRIETKLTKLSEKSFHLDHFLNEISELLLPSFTNKNIAFNIHRDPKIPSILSGSPALLHRILLNLLGNAVKFTHKGEVTLHISILKKNKDIYTLCFQVKDTGIGMSKSKLKTIFDPFTRLTSSYNSSYEGSGLGLYIIKQFVDLLNGSLDVESELKKGSTFSVFLDFSKGKDTAATKKSSPKQKALAS